MLWDLGVQCWLVVLQLTARPSHFAATKNRSLWTDLAGSRWWTVIGKRSNDYWYSKKGQWLVWRLEEMCKCNHVRLRAHGFLFPVFESRHETVNELTLKSREPPILVWLCNTMVSCNFLFPGLCEKKLRQSMRDGQARHGSLWRGSRRVGGKARWGDRSYPVDTGSMGLPAACYGSGITWWLDGNGYLVGPRTPALPNPNHADGPK